MWKYRDNLKMIKIVKISPFTYNENVDIGKLLLVIRDIPAVTSVARSGPG